jgi:hypothetical protein
MDPDPAKAPIQIDEQLEILTGVDQGDGSRLEADPQQSLETLADVVLPDQDHPSDTGIAVAVLPRHIIAGTDFLLA